MACHFTKILLKCNFTQTLSLEEHKINIKMMLRMKRSIIFYLAYITLQFLSLSSFAVPTLTPVLPLLYFSIIEDTVTFFSKKKKKQPILNHVSHLSVMKICFSNLLLHVQKHTKKKKTKYISWSSFLLPFSSQERATVFLMDLPLKDKWEHPNLCELEINARNGKKKIDKLSSK